MKRRILAVRKGRLSEYWRIGYPPIRRKVYMELRQFRTEFTVAGKYEECKAWQA
jgi:hypothetical protein